MSLALGKRKRAVTSKSTLPSKKATIAKATAPPPPPAPEPESDTEDKEALNDAFRRAFEKRFKAIEEDKPVEVEVEEEDEDEDEDDDEAWDGLSGEEEDDEDAIEVVEHNMSSFSRERADKAALKAFMVVLSFLQVCSRSRN